MTDEPLCAVCGLPRNPHHGPGTMHAFSLDGELTFSSPVPPEEPKKKRKKKKPKGGMDPVLRALLVSKGIITGEELMETGRRWLEDGILIVNDRVDSPDGDS